MKIGLSRCRRGVDIALGALVGIREGGLQTDVEHASTTCIAKPIELYVATQQVVALSLVGVAKGVGIGLRVVTAYVACEARRKVEGGAAKLKGPAIGGRQCVARIGGVRRSEVGERTSMLGREVEGATTMP